jgi:C4-dicarboxylate-specific signal transduction histidine kinase
MTDIPSLVNIKGASESSAVAPGSTRWVVRGAIAVALVGVAPWLGYAVAFQRGLDHLRAAAQQRLAVEAARLDGHLSRFEYLPSLLETSPSVFRLLGAFFGVGITSARAGYYLSHALKDGRVTRGIATVKVNLESFERAWRDIDSDILLLDERRVTILSSRDEWRFHPMAPLSLQMLDEISRSKPYGNHGLTPLGWNFVAQFSDGAARVTAENGAAYTVSERPIGELVRRLGRLTSQLRVFAYKSSSPLDAVAVEHAVAESLKILAARVKETGVDLVTDIDANPCVVADQTRLEQLLCNIVANALDAVESVDRKSILIRATRGEAQTARCRIVISNSGPTIASDVLQHMFEPFVTTKPAGKGLGLGLMLSNHIARSFGGELRARNLMPSGAEFVVIPSIGWHIRGFA